MMKFWKWGEGHSRSRGLRIMAVALTLGLIAAACGDDDNGAAPPATDPPADSGSGNGNDDNGGGNDVNVDFDQAWCGPLDETVTVQMTAGASTAYGSHWLAIANGYYEAENLDVEVVPLNRASDAMPLLAGGQTDAAVAGYSAATFNAIDGGMDLIGTISMGLYDPENPPGGIYVRKELVESGEVKEPSDLAGKRFAIDAPDGGSLRYIVSHWFREAGLDMDDVIWVEMPRDTIPQALVEGSTDFAYVPSNIGALVIEDGASELIGDPAWIANEGVDTLITILMNRDSLQNNRDVARAIVRANLLARQDLLGDYLSDDDTVDKLAEMINSDAEAIRSVPPFMWIEDGELVASTVMGMQEFFMDRGNLSYEELKPIEDLNDPRLREEALASIANCS